MRVSVSEWCQKINVRKRPPAGFAHGILVVAVVIIGVVLSWLWVGLLRTDSPLPEKRAKQPAGSANSTASDKRFPVVIRKPAGPPRVDTGVVDANGNPVTASCSTCHATRKPNHENKGVGDLNEFHSSMSMMHGDLSCLSCHNANDYDSLRLADGTRLPFSDVMTLCAQCHGQQMTDYKHGVHGGMNGYWDRTRGTQTKNNCIDCHHPHTPKFPKMQPTFKPRDRFLEPPQDH